jgi:uncharacterized protein (TIGR02246 family)
MTADEQAIRDLVARWHRATADGDVETVLGLMTPDVVFLVAGHAPMPGRDAFEQGLRKLLATHRVDSSATVREVVVSGDLAYCWTELDVRIRPLSGGDALRRSGSALTILRRQGDGAWQVVRDANLLSQAG